MTVTGLCTRLLIRPIICPGNQNSQMLGANFLGSGNDLQIPNRARNYLNNGP
jgi:hypothetical protein